MAIDKKINFLISYPFLVVSYAITVKSGIFLMAKLFSRERWKKTTLSDRTGWIRRAAEKNRTGHDFIGGTTKKKEEVIRMMLHKEHFLVVSTKK